MPDQLVFIFDSLQWGSCLLAFWAYIIKMRWQDCESQQCGDCLKYYSNAQPVILLACLSFTDLFVDKTNFSFVVVTHSCREVLIKV